VSQLRHLASARNLTRGAPLQVVSQLRHYFFQTALDLGCLRTNEAFGKVGFCFRRSFNNVPSVQFGQIVFASEVMSANAGLVPAQS
jgi:hypothetical protein